MIQKMLVRTAIAFVALLLMPGQRSAFADQISVTVNTSGLGSGNSEAFFILTGVGGNTATVSSVFLDGGTAGAVDTANAAGSGNGASNDLGTGISLTNGVDFLNVFAESFVAGGQFSFLLDLTTNVVLPNPDLFSLAILDSGGSPILTSDPTGFNNLVTINIDSKSPGANIYSHLVTVTAVPEPSSLMLISTGFLGLALGKFLTRRK